MIEDLSCAGVCFDRRVVATPRGGSFLRRRCLMQRRYEFVNLRRHHCQHLYRLVVHRGEGMGHSGRNDQVLASVQRLPLLSNKDLELSPEHAEALVRPVVDVWRCLITWIWVEVPPPDDEVSHAFNGRPSSQPHSAGQNGSLREPAVIGMIDSPERNADAAGTLTPDTDSDRDTGSGCHSSIGADWSRIKWSTTQETEDTCSGAGELWRRLAGVSVMAGWRGRSSAGRGRGAGW